MNFRILASDLPVGPLVARVRALPPEAWLAAELRREYQGSAHAAAEALLLRWPVEKTLEAAFYELDSNDEPAALELCPELPAVTNNLTDRVGKVLYTGRCLITRLAPGGRIDQHVDEGPYADIYDRFHVCLAGRALFRCGTEVLEPAPGEAFWFNRKQLHSVENGPEERLHLILDLEAPAYRKLRGVWVQEEMLPDCWEEMAGLYPEHYREVAFYQDIALEPAEEDYMALAARGAIRLYTLRDDARLVGYVVFLVRPNPHYESSLTAVQDVLYVCPSHRQGLIGVRLLRYAEQRLRAQGVQVVYHHVKRSTNAGRLLERLGYDLVDLVYAKRLDKNKGG